MKILLIGSGGREHALAHAIAASPFCEKLYIAPGNAGTERCGENVSLNAEDHVAARFFCRNRGIDLAVIGSEAQLADGLADALREGGTAVFGPGAEGARLESSKAFMKELCKEAGVPTADYACFSDAAEARACIEQADNFPLVIKADGLAAGKGVIIAANKEEALAAVHAMMEDKRFGGAGATVVIEEYLEGEEVSFFALVSDNAVLPFGAAQDHKRIGEGDRGDNTGGMGAYSPPPFFNKKVQDQVMQTVIEPLVSCLRARNIAYRGVIFAGLMMTKSGPKVLEFNARFGDPETQALVCRLGGDIVPLLYRTAVGNLRQTDAVALSDTHAVCVVAASKGYPAAYQKNTEIRKLEEAEASAEGVIIFHAGTGFPRGKTEGLYIAKGGRVLNAVAAGASLKEARDKAYAALALIEWDNMYFRRDIAALPAGDALPEPPAEIPPAYVHEPKARKPRRQKQEEAESADDGSGDAGAPEVSAEEPQEQKPAKKRVGRRRKQTEAPAEEKTEQAPDTAPPAQEASDSGDTAEEKPKKTRRGRRPKKSEAEPDGDNAAPAEDASGDNPNSDSGDAPDAAA